MAEEVLRRVPGLLPHAAFLRRLLARIPLPNIDAIAYLINRLLALRQLPWVRRLDEGDWPAAEVLGEIASVLASSELADRFRQFQARSTGLTQSHEAYTALRPKGGLVPPGHETLRAILVLTLWSLESPHQTPIATLGQAIRGVSANAGNPVGQLVGPITLARDRRQLADILDQKVAGTELAGLPRGLVDMIRAYYVPVMRGERPRVHFERDRSTDTPTPPPAQLPESDKPPEPMQRKPRSKDSRPRKRRETAVPRGFRPHRQTLPALRTRMRPPKGAEVDVSEPASETAPDEVLVDVGRPHRVMDHRAALFRAFQSIRGANGFLLPEHDAALSMDEARTCVRAALSHLQNALADRGWSQIRQWTRLLMVALTGKAPAVLSTIRLYSVIEVFPANRCVVDLTRGSLVQPVYRPSSAYAPEGRAGALVEPTVTHIDLPLLPSLLKALKQLRLKGMDAFEGGEAAWGSDVSEACKRLRESTGTVVFPGRLRSSFLCALQEIGNDVAATVLIVGDTLGQSEAPLYYYTPRVRDLEDIYLQAVQRLSGEQLPHVGGIERIGAQTLVRESICRQLARTLANAVHAGLGTDAASLVRLHRAMLTHTACALLTTVGHRSCRALFRLRRWDFDLDAGHAVFGDKQGDPGHFFRFVSIPDLMCRQLAAYLLHLEGLAQRCSSAIAERAAAAVEGGAPLFFDLSDSCDLPQELDLASFVKLLPAQWQDVRLNHGRTLIATRAREAGISASLVLTQLGHYEAIGFPFSKDGPTRPAAFAQQIRAALDDLAKRMGWRCVHGLKPSRPDCTSPWIPPLRDWDEIARYWECHIQEAHREALVQRRAAEREAREQGVEAALAALSEVAPQLTKHIISGRSTRVAPADAELLSDADIERVSEVLVARAEGDAIRTAANLRGLAQVLAKAARRLNWLGARPPYRVSLPREETVPFFPGMFGATRQLIALRNLAGQGFPNNSTAPISESDCAFARAALLLIAMGHVESEDELAGLLTHRSRLRRSQHYPAFTLLEWQDKPRRVSMVHGIAAAALGALARKYPDLEPIKLDALDGAIRGLLPMAWVGNDGPVIPRLLSMVRIANRIELSPLARLALNPITGSSSASVEEQLAFLDGSAFHAELETSADSTATSAPVADVQRYLGVERSQSGVRPDYLAVLACLPRDGSDTPLPLSRLTISAVDRDRSRSLIRRELELRAAEPNTHPTAMSLALWSLSLLNRRHRGKPVALSTVATYVSAVGGPLTTLAGNVYPGDLDEDELTELLVTAVACGSKKHETQARAAREMLNFAAFCARNLGWPEVDEDEFRPFLGVDDSAESDASLLLPQQVDPAIDRLLLDAQFDSTPSGDTREIRLLRQAGAGLALLRASGARRGEVLGLRLGDISTGGGAIGVHIAANTHRSLKTRASTRRLALGERIVFREAHHLRTWLEAERLRLPEHRRGVGYVFSARHNDKDLTVKGAVAQAMACILGDASGRGRDRLHRLRHLACGETLGTMAFQEAGLDTPEHWRSPLTALPAQERILWPRELRRASLKLGHSGPTTQVVHYLHLPWVLRIAASEEMRLHPTRSMAAAALLQSVSGVDRISQRNKPHDTLGAWVRHVVPALSRSAALGKDPPSLRTSKPTVALSAVDVAYLLDQVREGIGLEVAGFALGATSTQVAEVRAACERFEELSRYRLLTSPGDRRTRTHTRSMHLYRMLDWACSETSARETSVGGLLDEVVMQHAFTARLSRADTIAMPSTHMEALLQVLKASGHDANLMDRWTRGDVDYLRVGRPEVGGRFSGRELRRIMAILWVARQLRAANPS